MDLRHIPEHDWEAAFLLGGAEDRAECFDNYRAYPDLFVGGYDQDRIVGVCYGWPFLEARSGSRKMFLGVIAIDPAYQRQGHGSRLLRFWEEQVSARGRWTVSIGSAADEFYLKNGCTPVEYCLKVHEADLARALQYLGDAISHIRYEEAPLVVLYVKTGGQYHPEVLEEMGRAVKAQGQLFIFEKTVG